MIQKGFEMEKFKSVIISLLVLLIMACVGFILIDFFAAEEVNEEVNDSVPPVTRNVELVALGDSLTEGVGDSTHRGGYVPLIAETLRSDENVRRVSTRNHGVSGDTTDDLLQLIEENEEVRSSIEQATIIPITIGGNDVTQTFRQVGLNATMEDFEDTLEHYEENLHQIFSTIQSLNEETDIYIFGIYNPYHYYFSEFEELQEVFNLWNHTTVEVAEEYEGIEFVEIDSLFNPLDIDVASSEELELLESVEDVEDDAHPYLYEEDMFHPNDEGYQMMATALYEAIIEKREE